MKVRSEWQSAYEFACHSGACAPPPAGRGGSLPGTQGGNHKAAYEAMKKREAAQAKLAQTNRARANYGMPALKASVDTEEFFNHHHARSTGRFASGPGGGFFSPPKTSKKMPKLFKQHSQSSEWKQRSRRVFMPRNRKGMIFGTHTEEFTARLR